MRFSKVRENLIKEKTNGRELSKVLLLADCIEFIFNDGTRLKSEKLTKERLDWMRLQSGIEKEYKDLVYELLIKKLVYV